MTEDTCSREWLREAVHGQTLRGPGIFLLVSQPATSTLQAALWRASTGSSPGASTHSTQEDLSHTAAAGSQKGCRMIASRPTGTCSRTVSPQPPHTRPVQHLRTAPSLDVSQPLTKTRTCRQQLLDPSFSPMKTNKLLRRPGVRGR